MSCLSTRITDMKNTHATLFPAEPHVIWRASVLVSLEHFTWTLGKCVLDRTALPLPMKGACDFGLLASGTCGALNCTALRFWICIHYLCKGPSNWCLMLCIKVYIIWSVAAAVVGIISSNGMYHLLKITVWRVAYYYYYYCSPVSANHSSLWSMMICDLWRKKDYLYYDGL